MKIAIVGLGPAGCRAAMLLAEAGHRPSLFEARDRLGGRLESWVHGDGFFEAGGEWLDADHHRVLDLCVQLGTPAEASQQWPGTVVFRGERCPENEVWEDCVRDQLALEEAVDTACLDLVPTPWENVLSMEEDGATLATLLDRVTRSPRGRWFLEATLRSDEGDDSDRIGLLGWLLGQLPYQERSEGDMSAYRLPLGGEAFCRGMLASAGLTPRLSCALRSVRRDGEGVILGWDDGEEWFDRVILTLPPPALMKVDFDYVSEDKRHSWEQAGMSRAIKVGFVCDEKFWEDSPRTICDLPIQQVWDATRAGAPPTLACYVCGDEAEQLLAEQDPGSVARNHLEQLFPAAVGHVRKVVVADWIHDPWAGGAFPHYPPDYVLGCSRAVWTPEARIHFAGDYCAQWLGFIEGALESAERVVGEVLGS